MDRKRNQMFRQICQLFKYKQITKGNSALGKTRQLVGLQIIIHFRNSFLTFKGDTYKSICLFFLQVKIYFALKTNNDIIEAI